MKREVDVLVIGAGVIGICSAHYISSRAGRRHVTVVERGEVCSGCSYGNAGMLVPSHSVPLSAPGVVRQALKWLLNPESPFYVRPRLDIDLIRWLIRFWLSSSRRHSARAVPLLRDLSFASLRLYDELAQLPGVEFGLQRRGILNLCRTESGLEHCAAQAAALASQGIRARRVGRSEIAELEPNVETTACGGIYYEEDCHLTPVRFVRELAGHVQSNGVDILTGTEVLGLERNGSKITTVRTTRGDLCPQEVVLAAGSWSPALARDLSLRIPIQPGKGYSATFKKPDPSPSMPLVCEEARFGITPMGETLRIAGTLELAGFDLAINERRVHTILRSVPQYLPQLQPEKMELIELWRGLRPCSPDGLPYLGRPKALENVVVAAGHAMIGVSLGPVTGSLVAGLVAGDEPSIDLGLLRVERYG